MKTSREKIRDHLIQQHAQARGIGSSGCRYRGDHGMKCAVGCLIEDADYKDGFERRGIQSLVKSDNPRALLWTPPHDITIAELADWQSYHDSCVWLHVYGKPRDVAYSWWIETGDEAHSPNRMFELMREIHK